MDQSIMRGGGFQAPVLAELPITRNQGLSGEILAMQASRSSWITSPPQARGRHRQHTRWSAAWNASLESTRHPIGHASVMPRQAAVGCSISRNFSCCGPAQGTLQHI